MRRLVTSFATASVRAAAVAALAWTASWAVPARGASWDGVALSEEASRLNAKAAEAAADGRTQEAMRTYIRAAKADVANAEAMYRLGGLLLEAGMADKAAAVMGRVLAAYPGDPDARIGRAAAVAGRDDPSAADLAMALEDLDIAEAAAGASAPIAYFRSRLCYRAGDLDGAAAAAREARWMDAEEPVSAAQTELYKQQEQLCNATRAALSPLD